MSIGRKTNEQEKACEQKSRTTHTPRRGRRETKPKPPPTPKMTQEQAQALSREIAGLARARGAHGVIVAICGPDEWGDMDPHPSPGRTYRNLGWHWSAEDGMENWIFNLAVRMAVYFGVTPEAMNDAVSENSGSGGAGKQ